LDAKDPEEEEEEEVRQAGHLLSHHLTKYLQNNAAFHFGTRLQREVVQPRLQFDPIKKCTRLALKPGTITLLEAPQFHCKKEDLAMLFMKNPDKNNKSNKKIKFGVKLLHLVRNPFEMAVSNYHYHAQDPTPEPFVHTVNPCESLRQNNIGPANMNEVDLVQPKLAHPILPGMDPIMDFGAFGAITKDCQSLFRTRPGLEDASYYRHLRTLDPKEGLRLATADKFNHFALMASDLLVLEQVRKLVYERNVHRPAKHHEFALLTMSMEEWKESPERSMRRFLEFTFGKLMPDERKEYLARRYGKQYLAKTILSEHVTEGKVGDESDKEELMEYLRGNAVFGGPLTRMEGLVNEMLRWQEAGYGIEG